MKNLIFIAFLLMSTASFAQGKFIEVEVTDTITLKPLGYRCNLYVDTYDYDVVVEAASETDVTADTTAFIYDDYTPEAVKEKGRKKIVELTKMLESKNYKVSPLDESSLNVMERRNYDKAGVTVVVNTMAELENLKYVLDSRPDVVVAVSVLKYEDEQKAEEVLIKRLLNKAKKRVAVIGTNSGLKPGRILEVKEGKKSSDFNVSDFYSQILKLDKYGQGMDAAPASLSKTFVVKFSAE